MCSVRRNSVILIAGVLAAAALKTVLAEISCYSDTLCPPDLFCSSWSFLSPTCLSADACYAETDPDRALRYLSKATENLKGQDHVLERVLGLVTLKMGDWDRRINLHFAGDNGVGKTWLAKTIGAALSMKPSRRLPGSGTNFHMLDVLQYIDLDQSDNVVLKAARDDLMKEIATVLTQCPRAVILVEEIELLPPKVATALIPLFKGNPIGKVPTKWATFIMTSDFGRQGMAAGMSWEQVEQKVREVFEGLYTDLTISSYVTILPFTSFTAVDFHAIATARFRRLPCNTPEIQCVAWDRDAVEVIANATLRGTKERNARELDSKFDNLVGIQIAARIRALKRHPNTAFTRRLNVTVKGDPGGLIVDVQVSELPLAPDTGSLPEL